jgi:DNA-binding transcriptional MerR regulator
MTTEQLCQTTGLTERELRNWIDYGLLNADLVGRDGGGVRREFSQDQVERACLLRALHRKGATLAQLARANLTLDGQAFVVYDGTSCAPAGMPPRRSPR